MSNKPQVNVQGRVVVEIDQQGVCMVMMPDGEIFGAATKVAAERKIRRILKAVSDNDKVNVATIEWREI